MQAFIKARLALAAAVFVVPVSPTCAQSISQIDFGQVDWYGPADELLVDNSLWGTVDLTYAPDTTQRGFLNLVSSYSGGSAAWSVQNLPIFESDDTSSQQLRVDLDLGELGVTVGTPVANLDYYYTIDPAPIFSAPTGVPISATVSSMINRAWSECGSPAPGVFDPGTPYGIKITANPDTTGGNRKIKAVQEDNCRCFTGATARSINWLKGGTNAQQIYNELKAKIPVPPPGGNVKESETSKIRLKNEYAKPKGITTKVYDAIDFLDPIPGVAEKTPAIEDLNAFLDREWKTEDVELAYYWTGGAHIVTLTKYTKSGDKWLIGYRDDEWQGNPNRGDTMPKEGMLYKKDGRWRFGSDANRVWYAMSESVPEPSSIATLLIGIMCLARLRRRMTLHR